MQILFVLTVTSGASQYFHFIIYEYVNLKLIKLLVLVP